MSSDDQIKNIQRMVERIVERLSCFMSKTVENLLFGKATYEETHESLTEFVNTELVIQTSSHQINNVERIVERLSCFMSKTVENLLFGKATYEETQESLTEFVKTNLVILTGSNQITNIESIVENYNALCNIFGKATYEETQ